MASQEETHVARQALIKFEGKFQRFSESPMEVHKHEPGDVYICTFPKSGTTLLRQMVYQMAVASGGGPRWDPEGEAFEYIDEVVPLLDIGHLLGTDVNSTITNPRVYGTHLPPQYTTFSSAKDAKVIYCLRNPDKIPASLLDFLEGNCFPGMLKSEREREVFYHMFVKEGFLQLEDSDNTTKKKKQTPFPNWFDHVKSWMDIADERILVLSYEGMCKDVRAAAKHVAKFLGLELSENGFDTVAARCSREYMLSDKFKIMKSLPWFEGEPPSFVRALTDTEFHAFKFSDEEKDLLHDMIRKELGVDSYAELINTKAVM